MSDALEAGIVLWDHDSGQRWFFPISSLDHAASLLFAHRIMLETVEGIRTKKKYAAFAPDEPLPFPADEMRRDSDIMIREAKKSLGGPLPPDSELYKELHP